MRYPAQEFYFKSAEEMGAIFKDVPEAIDNTVSIAKRCDLEFTFGRYQFPVFATPKGVILGKPRAERSAALG